MKLAVSRSCRVRGEMRLTATQFKTIHQTTRQYFGADAAVWLFGSRADDRQRGGDIDLYVETAGPAPLRQVLRCKLELEEKLDLRVDLVIKAPGEDKPIFNIAKETGVRL